MSMFVAGFTVASLAWLCVMLLVVWALTRRLPADYFDPTRELGL